MDPTSIFAEYGAIGVVCALFSYMVMNIIKSLKSQDEDLDDIRQHLARMDTEISNIESIILKMLDRWNISDTKRAKIYEGTNAARSKTFERFGNRLEYLEKEMIRVIGKLESRWSSKGGGEA